MYLHVDTPCFQSNTDPEGEIFLSYMDRVMMDCFSPKFPFFFVGQKT